MERENISLEKLFENGFLSNLENEIKNKIDSVLVKIHEFEVSSLNFMADQDRPLSFTISPDQLCK
jgi:hypothetical protein